MDDTSTIRGTLADIQARCDAGFAVALHVQYTTPRFLFQTYDPSWTKVYSEKGLVLKDPTVRWGLEHDGMIDWHELEQDDPAQVLRLAREFGIQYGFTLSISDGGTRSVGSFTRKDVQFTPDDKSFLSSKFLELHQGTSVSESEKSSVAELFRKLSVDLTR